MQTATTPEKKHIIKKIKSQIEPKEEEIYSKELLEYLSQPRKVRLAEYLSRKKEAPKTEEQKALENGVKNILFAALKKTIDGAKTANRYLFELAKRFELTKNLQDGIYKIIVTKKEKNGIECTLQ
jgi:hypothetical protein